MEVAKGEESEELDVAFENHLEQEAPEGEGPDVLTDFVVEEAMEEAIEEDEQDDSVGNNHDEVLDGASKEEAVFAFDLDVLLVGVGIVVGEGWQDAFFDEGQIVGVDDFLLLGLDEPDGPEDG